MPTPDRIRLTITVTPEVHAAFSRMAAAGGLSLGRTMGDWLADTVEGAQFVAGQMEKAKGSPKEVMRKIHSMTASLQVAAEAELESLQAGRTRPVAPPAASRVGVPPAASFGPSGRGAAPSSNTGRLETTRGGKR